MLASIISTVGKYEDKGAWPDLRVEYSQIQTLLKAPTTKVKTFLYFKDQFCGTLKKWGLKPLVLLISGRPGRFYTGAVAKASEVKEH